MQKITGWDGPLPRQGTDDICYQKMIEPARQDVKEMKWDLESIKARLSQQKALFIKVRGNKFSGGVRCLGPCWEIVFESGKWIKYSLDIATTPQGDIAIVNGDFKVVRIGNGNPLDLNIRTIQEMASWLEGQI